MRAELRRADERYEVLRAVADWRAEGGIDDDAAAAIRARFPDDRRRARPAFRVLFFLFTLLAGQSIWGFGALFIGVTGSGSVGNKVFHMMLLVLMATLAAAGAAHAIGGQRLRGFGVEEGLVALAVGFEGGALGLALDLAGADERTILGLLGANLAAVALAVAWRWGILASGALATGGLFLALAMLPWPRLAWIVAAVLVVPLAWHLANSERTAPAHRRRADEAFAVALAALYFAVHPARIIGHGFRLGATGVDAAAPLAATLTALAWCAIFALPAGLLALGLARRARLALALGALGLLASTVSALDALDAGPPWALLLGGGALLGALALALRAAFDHAGDRVLGGFTDRPLGADAQGHWLELAATLAALAPAPAPRPAEPAAGFQGEGGEFGGGGASARI